MSMRKDKALVEQLQCDDNNQKRTVEDGVTVRRNGVDKRGGW